jgi:hypothetical protein
VELVIHIWPSFTVSKSSAETSLKQPFLFSMPDESLKEDHLSTLRFVQFLQGPRGGGGGGGGGGLHSCVHDEPSNYIKRKEST